MNVRTSPIHRTVLASLVLLLLGALPVQAQIFPITQPAINSCSGALVDSGGEGNPGYSDNENFTTTICPDAPGNAISLQFVTFDLSLAGAAPYDVITVYDGNSTSAPVLGTFNGGQMPPILSGSFDNPSGCLTVQFTSNAQGTGTFSAVITCSIPCDPPTAVATMGEAIPALVCQDEVLTFNASGSYAAPGRTIVEYKWDFDDGSPLDSLSGAVVQHSFAQTGEYMVQLILTDDIGCNNVNVIDQQILVSTTPSFNAFASDTVICQGNTISLDASNIEAVTWSAVPNADFGDGIYLPDELGVPFTSQITFGGFTAGQTLTDVSLLESVCVTMEHSFMGDFVLSLASPSGQTVTFHQQGGAGTFLGEPVDDESMTPGVCYTYCFTPDATNGTWVDNSGSGTLPAGNYESLQSMTGFVGSPLNGSWTLTFVDLWGADNGFMCSWAINFDPSLYPDLVEFTPVLGVNDPDSAFWAGTSTLLNDPSAPLVGTATPDAEGVAIYAFSVTDNFGCTYDTTISVLVNPSPGANPIIVGDTIICANEGVVLEVQGQYPEYQWSNGFNGSIVLVGPGTYTVVAGAGDCVMESQPFVVQEAPQPDPVISGVLFNCSGDPAVLSTTEPYAQYQWSNGSTASSISVGTGTYSVTVVNTAGCSGTSPSVNVLTAEAPNAAFTANPSGAVNIGSTVNYTAQDLGPNVASAIWTLDSVVVGSGAGMEQTYLEPGEYNVILTVTTVEGCQDIVVYHQVVYPDEIIVPNVFSPNGDGRNDQLAFEGAQYYPNTEVKVFNRYGQVLFESNNYKNTWNANGVPDGTYYFVLKLFTGKEYTGHVTLLR